MHIYIMNRKLHLRIYKYIYMHFFSKNYQLYICMTVARAVLCAVILCPLVVCQFSIVAFARKVTLVSDIHYDSFYGTSEALQCRDVQSPIYGTAGCDSPLALLLKLTEGLTLDRGELLLGGGDYQRHSARSSDSCSATVEVVSYHLGQTTIPPNQVVGTIGNNDVVPGYSFDINKIDEMQMKCLSDTFGRYSLLSGGEQLNNMAKCGYAAFTTGNLVVLSLNTLLWSYRIRPSIPESVSDPCGQFNFMNVELTQARAAGHAVIILSHIPPIIDIYSLILRGAFTNIETDMYYKPDYQKRYFDVVESFSDVIRLQMYGHTHGFTLHAIPRVRVPLLVIPAVSPIFANIPSYFSAIFTDDWHLTELHHKYFLSGALWLNGLEVGSALGLKFGFDNVTDMNRTIYDFIYNNVTWTNYLKLRGGGEMNLDVFANAKCGEFCRVYSVCGMVSETYEDIKNCTERLVELLGLDKNKTTESGHFYIKVIVMIAISVFVVIALAFLFKLLFSMKNNARNKHRSDATSDPLQCRVLPDDERRTGVYSSTGRYNNYSVTV